MFGNNSSFRRHCRHFFGQEGFTQDPCELPFTSEVDITTVISMLNALKNIADPITMESFCKTQNDYLQKVIKEKKITAGIKRRRINEEENQEGNKSTPKTNAKKIIGKENLNLQKGSSLEQTSMNIPGAVSNISDNSKSAKETKKEISLFDWYLTIQNSKVKLLGHLIRKKHTDRKKVKPYDAGFILARREKALVRTTNGMFKLIENISVENSQCGIDVSEHFKDGFPKHWKKVLQGPELYKNNSESLFIRTLKEKYLQNEDYISHNQKDPEVSVLKKKSLDSKENSSTLKKPRLNHSGKGKKIEVENQVNMKNQADKVKLKTDKVKNQADKVKLKTDKVKNQTDKVKLKTEKVKNQADKVKLKTDKVKNQAKKVENQTDKLKNKANQLKRQEKHQFSKCVDKSVQKKRGKTVSTKDLKITTRKSPRLQKNALKEIDSSQEESDVDTSFFSEDQDDNFINLSFEDKPGEMVNRCMNSVRKALPNTNTHATPTTSAMACLVGGSNKQGYESDGTVIENVKQKCYLSKRVAKTSKEKILKDSAKPSTSSDRKKESAKVTNLVSALLNPTTSRTPNIVKQLFRNQKHNQSDDSEASGSEISEEH